MSDDQMTFPNTWEEFEKIYGFTDKEEIYTNGARLIPSFRVEQWLDHLQVVPIVRCKDCKWGKETCGNIECRVDKNLPPEYHGYYWYCPNGEGKEK